VPIYIGEGVYTVMLGDGATEGRGEGGGEGRALSILLPLPLSDIVEDLYDMIVSTINQCGRRIKVIGVSVNTYRRSEV